MGSTAAAEEVTIKSTITTIIISYSCIFKQYRYKVWYSVCCTVFCIYKIPQDNCNQCVCMCTRMSVYVAVRVWLLPLYSLAMLLNNIFWQAPMGAVYWNSVPKSKTFCRQQSPLCCVH
jgi:hypothetical protein